MNDLNRVLQLLNLKLDRVYSRSMNYDPDEQLALTAVKFSLIELRNEIIQMIRTESFVKISVKKQ